MSAFSARSVANLAGVHPTLVKLLSEITKDFDCSILGGTRTLEEQKQNVAKGLSQTMDSLHLIQSDGWGHAVDVAPTPQRWDGSPKADLTKYEVECIAFLFYVKGYAKAQGTDISIGADWNNNNLWDGFEKPNAFNDLDHIQLKVSP